MARRPVSLYAAPHLVDEPLDHIRVCFRFTADGIEPYIGGIITFHETLVDHKAELDTQYKGTPFSELIAKRGIVPGIKTDQGTIPLLGAQQGETTTQGLDGLQKRSEEYYNKGAR
jgi:fructose-bisphosphate aldolase class I